jgi:hypothetical protein
VIRTPTGTSTTSPAPGKPCGNDLGLTVKFVPNKLDTPDTQNAVGGDPFTLSYTELSAPDPNQLVFNGVTSTVYGTDLLVRRVYLDNGTSNISYFDDPVVGDTLNPVGAGGVLQVLACVALAFDLTKTVDSGITGSHDYTFSIACSNNGGDPIAFERTITINGAGSSTILAPVPPGYDCTVNETKIDGQALPLAEWVVEGNPATLENVGSSSTVTITNKPAKGALRFTKTVNGAVTGETSTFSFSANCGAAGTFTFTLPEADATPLVWDKADLPVGTSCTVTETSSTPAGAWTVSPASSTAVIVAGTTVDAALTNDRNTAKLTLVKSVSGGSASASSWTLTATGPGSPATTISGTSGAPAVTAQVVPTATYTLSESGTVADYTNGATWNCGSKGAALTSVSLSKGDDVTCTVTNTRDTATLTLVKNVSGGSAAASSWTLSATGPTAGVSGVSGAAAVTNRVVDTGSYALSEAGSVAGYSNGSTWDCGAKGASLASVSLAKGDNVTCTITNTRDAASLTLVKVVSGGSATKEQWTLSATGDAAAGSTVLSGAGGATGSVPTGTYSLAEVGNVTGYTNGATWDCGAKGAAVTSVSLAKGDSVTCTIMNTRDTAKLTLVKQVSGGSASPALWNLAANGPTPTSGAGGFVATVLTGSYTLSETGTVAGYTNGTTWNCGAKGAAVTSVTLNKGDDVICTIINTRDTATLTLAKNVVGGSAPASSWTLSATGPTAGVTGASGSAAVTAKVVDTGSYALLESGSVASYLNGTTWDCGAKGAAVTSVALAKGDNVTCTISNRFAAIDVVKSVALAVGGVCPATGYVDSLSPVLVGSSLCFQFVATNAGSAPFSSVTLVDSRFNLQTTPTTCTAPTTPYLTNGLNLGPMVVGASVTCVSGPVLAVFNGGATYVNTATVVGCAGATCTPSPSDSDTASYAPGYLGFTPGFWKNHTDVNSNNAWQAKYIGACMSPNGPLLGVAPWTTTIGAVFPGIETTGNDPKISTGYPQPVSLLTALGLGGGSGLPGANQNLLRAAVAAYLNACYSATLLPGGGAGAYPLTTAQVINQTVAALNSSSRSAKLTLAATLDLYNNTATHQIAW